MKDSVFSSNRALLEEVELVKKSIREEIHKKSRNLIDSPSAVNNSFDITDKSDDEYREFSFHRKG